MSDGNNRNDNLQDYLDLLSKYSDVELSEEIEPEKINEETAELYSTQELVNINFSDYSDDVESDIPKEEQKNASPPPFIGKIKEKTKQNKVIKKISDWYNNLPRKKQILVEVIAVILGIIILLSVALGVFVSQKFGLLGDNINKTDYEEVVYDEEQLKDIEIDIGSAGFKQALIDWATIGNDRHMSNKDVINVLLIGADSRSGTNSGNTDVMMLLSLNKQTKELKLVSFLRDSYLYVESPNGSYCTKLNAAFSMGGPETLVQTIENNYKIDIDNYVMVNFESFKAIIDAMGGVTVDVQQYEADYNYKKFKVWLPAGEGVTLNGEQALCFCRIRGCDTDGDVSRTRRQRQVIDSIVTRVKEASVSDLNKYIDILLPYVETGYSKGQILSLGIKAITGGWAGYERTQLQMPPEDCRVSGSADMWIWVVDYQLAAHELQTELYGQSNITIDDDRISIIDVYRGANYTRGGNTINNITVADKSEVSDEPATPDIPDTPETPDTPEEPVATSPVTNNNVTETEPAPTEANKDTTAVSENDVTENTQVEETEPTTIVESTEAQTTPETAPATTAEQVEEDVEDVPEDDGNLSEDTGSEETPAEEGEAA